MPLWLTLVVLAAAAASDSLAAPARGPPKCGAKRDNVGHFGCLRLALLLVQCQEEEAIFIRNMPVGEKNAQLPFATDEPPLPMAAAALRKKNKDNDKT